MTATMPMATQSQAIDLEEQAAYRIDKHLVRRSFDRAANQYDASAVLQHQVREEMLSRLDLVKLSPQRMLDAGCGTGHGIQALSRRFPQAEALALDIAPAMLQQTRSSRPWYQFYKPAPALVCADIEQLPLADNSLDLVWSNLALQWCNDLDAAFQGFKRALKPEGLLMFATFGPDTLKELRTATAQDGTTHVSRFIDMHDIGDALTRAGFSAPVLDVMHYTLTYDTVQAVMRDLKAIGAHNATAGRARGLKGRGFLAQLEQAYEGFRKNGKLPATYEVVFAHAWVGQKTVGQKSALPDGLSPLQFVPKRHAK